MSIALSLIALVLGYKVFLDASKEKEGLKLLGQSIGIFLFDDGKILPHNGKKNLPDACGKCVLSLHLGFRALSYFACHGTILSYRLSLGDLSAS